MAGTKSPKKEKGKYGLLKGKGAKNSGTESIK